MKIHSINIKNFKGIESFKGEIKGKNVYLIGGNATGKSSFIDAVWCGLTGKNIPPEPTKDGAKKGIIEIEIGDFIARTKFTRGRPTVFELENKNAEKESDKFVKAPRAFMESKIGILNFDINDFFNKSDTEQLKYFAKIMDKDFSDIDSEIEENEDSRKFDKKRLKVLEGTLDSYDKAELSKELVDVVELSKKIAAEKTKTETYNNIEYGIAKRETESIEINKEIAKLQQKSDTLDKEIIAGSKWLLDSDNIPLIHEDMAELELSLENVTETNAKITEAKSNKSIEDEIETLENDIESNNKNIEDLRADKAKQISKLIKVEGLSYDVNGERFLYNGLPFDKNQINTAAQLIAGMKIGASTLKELKILKVDASLIDKNNFEEVLEWAKSENIELFIELVDRECTKLQIIVDADN